MTTTTPLSVFHQWLLADADSKVSACAIILHGADARGLSRLIIDIAQYLNEYDDEGDGRWLPASDELITKIACDPNHRRLLGLSEESSGSPEEFLETMKVIGTRGHVVFHSPAFRDVGLELTNTFNAGVGHGVQDRCHIIVDPELMGHKCVARVIGDVFLEWLHSEVRETPPNHELR